MKTPENTIDRFKKALDENRFTMDVELGMLELLVMKYNPMSISDLARKRGVTQPAISKQLKEGKLMYIQFGSIKIIIGE
tara:strand:- start:2007 stop:2243 length:237 start_codon:yes stop_codon:yes gene_type:complete